MAAPIGIVLEAVSAENYRYWSLLVKNYLRGEGLWDGVIEDFPDANIEDWSRKNAKALHAIQLACGSGHLSKITECSTARDAWDILKLSFSPGSRADQDEDEKAIRAEEVLYRELLKFVERGDVEGVSRCISDHPQIISRASSSGKGTVIHLAVMGGNVEIVKDLVNVVPQQVLEMEDEDGYTALALVAAFTDSKSMAESLINLDKNKDLLVKKASKGAHKDLIPLVMAADMARKQLTAYLYQETPRQILEEDNHKYAALLFQKCINSEIFDVALDLIKIRYANRDLPLNYHGSDGMGPLCVLAKMPSAFRSGSQFPFWQRWIYDNLSVTMEYDSESTSISITSAREDVREPQTNTSLAGRWWEPLSYLAPLKILGALLRLFQHHLLRYCPAIEGVYQQKLLHCQVEAILRCICERISKLSRSELREVSAYDAMLQAAKNGIIEFIGFMSSARPEILWESIDQNERGIFAHAILHRRREVFELIHRLSGRKKKITCSRDRSGNNLLHLAAMLGPSSDLDQRSGPALQMQRELQWFKEVENNVDPKYKRDTNNDGKKAQEVFAQSHKELRKEAEKWAKETATSFIVVGTLIMAIISVTLPGGNDQNTGKPMFLGDKIFTVFIMADVFALFASSSSVLIFFGVLTSRCAEKDFLTNLPRKLLFGFLALFVSVVSMSVAFCAAFFMMLRGYTIVSWTSMVLVVATVLLILLPSQYRRFSQIFGSSIGFKPIRVEKKNPSHRIYDRAISTLKRCIGY